MFTNNYSRLTNSYKNILEECHANTADATKEHTPNNKGRPQVENNSFQDAI